MINKVKLIGRSHMKEKEPSLIRTARGIGYMMDDSE